MDRKKNTKQVNRSTDIRQFPISYELITKQVEMNLKKEKK